MVKRMAKKMAKTKEYYKSLLPDRLTVEIHKEKNEIWAKVKELPHCYTQANSFLELVDMLNDAIYTYLSIPKKYQKEVGYYIPQEVVDEVRRQQYQNVYRKIIENVRMNEQKEKKVEIFRLQGSWQRETVNQS